MTRGFFTASVAVAAALSIGPVTSGLMNRQAVGTDASVTTADHLVIDAPSRVRNLPPAASDVEFASTDALARPMLTMVPRSPKLQSRLGDLLPPGMTVRQAAMGFGDQSQFVSAVHISHTLAIPFGELKAKIVDERMSLGQAIHALRPDADVWRELTRVRELTSRDIY